MLRYYSIIRESSFRIADAIENTVHAFAEGRIEQEPAFTDRMLGAIEQTLNSFQLKGIMWHAKTLTDRGRKAQEKDFGADFMVVLNINLHDFKVDKGFLAQAKMASPRINIRELHSQCERMLKLSPDSFVFLYSVERVIVVPAISVISTQLNPAELYYRSAARFFEEHFESFIGDRNISAPNVDVLKRLKGQEEITKLISTYNPKHLIYLQAKDGLH